MSKAPGFLRNEFAVVLPAHGASAGAKLLYKGEVVPCVLGVEAATIVMVGEPQRARLVIDLMGPVPVTVEAPEFLSVMDEDGPSAEE